MTEREYEICRKAYTQELEGLRKCVKNGTTVRKHLEREEKEERERKEKEEKEEKERKEREYKASICTASMEKIIDESRGFRADNDLRKLSKSQDFSQYLPVSLRSKVDKVQAHECGHKH